MERSILKTQISDIITALKKKNYVGSEKYALFLSDNSTGLGPLKELELDRVQVFQFMYGKEEWKDKLRRAHDWVLDGEIEYAVDYILINMEYGEEKF